LLDSYNEFTTLTHKFAGDDIKRLEMFPNTLFTTSFHLSDTVNVYERQVYSILDMLGDVGGLMDALTPLARMLVTIFSS